MLRTNLPSEIVLKCGTVLKHRMSTVPGVGRSHREVIAEIKKRGGKYRVIDVLAKNLRGKEDLHRRPYRPNRWIITNVDLRDIDTPKS
jgi:hypothetical protein